MSITKVYRVYGKEGHRQRESFHSSHRYDWSDENLGTRIVEVGNADKTGTNEYSLVRINRNTAEECDSELSGQITDGIFENSRVGKVVELVTTEQVDVTVYASITGLFSEEECDKDNLTQIRVDKAALCDWVDQHITYFKSYGEFLDTYTADDTESLVYWLLDNGYGLDIPGRKVYRYGMRLRPSGPGCQPKGFVWRENDYSGKYHDIVVYKEPLSEEDIAHYSLDILEKTT